MKIILRTLFALSAALAVIAFYSSIKLGAGDAVAILGCLFAILAVLSFGFEGVLDRLDAIKDKR